ncbi:unnamed protein product [Ambrosiozyma monospora]|uniref:Unnamed protein product n=1 Tax=Ambrosiozyma monospora TaxID=43982 RepID=A0A9W6YUN0_AMBMO|nr:unnamed protein product [Ambrosiozyma monospora]
MVKQIYSERANIKLLEAKQAMDESGEDEISVRLDQAKFHNELDLHGLSVKSAVRATEEALSFWWDSEISYRERRNANMKLVRAQAGDFRVITGRGLHSAGGQSKIKGSVNKFLRVGGFTFKDDGGAFIVTGKKRS